MQTTKPTETKLRGRAPGKGSPGSSRGTINDLDLPRNLYVNPDGTQAPELTDQERRELRRCEQVIRQGLRSFVAVGQALLTIRDRKLYQVTAAF